MVELKFPEVLVLSGCGSLLLLSLNRLVPCGQKKLGENDTCLPGLRKFEFSQVNF